MNVLKWRSRARSRGAGGAGIALAVVLIGGILGVTGGAHAAGLITGKQIKDESVTGRDVRNATISSKDLADGSLTPGDYVDAVAGPPGAVGDPGQDGANGVVLRYRVTSRIDFVNPGQIATAVAECDPGHVAIGGGLGSAPGRLLQLLDSAPLGTDAIRRASWVVRAHNGTTIDVPVTAYALCAEVQP